MARVPSPITLWTAPIRSGKSYCVVREIVDEVLPTTDLKVFTNIELEIDAIDAYGVEKYGVAPGEWAARLHVIPQHELDDWKYCRSGPLVYFESLDVDQARIYIDEVHNFCSKSHTPGHKASWGKWLGEIGHRGASVVLISQNVGKIPQNVVDEAAATIQLQHSDMRHEPIFNIALADWYQLRAKAVGHDVRCVWMRQGQQNGKRFVLERETPFWILPRYFKFYNSHSAPVAGGLGGQREEQPWQRFGWGGLLWWFFRRNAFRIGIRSWRIWLPIVLMCAGGDWIVTHFIYGVANGFAGHALVRHDSVSGSAVSGDTAGVPVGAGVREVGGEGVAGIKRTAAALVGAVSADAGPRLIAVGDTWAVLSDSEVLEGGLPVARGTLEGLIVASYRPSMRGIVVVDALGAHRYRLGDILTCAHFALPVRGSAASSRPAVMR